MEGCRPAAIFWEQNISPCVALHTFNLCWYIRCHGPSNLSSRPKQGLKPNSTQQGPSPSSLEKTILFLEITGHCVQIASVKILKCSSLVTKPGLMFISKWLQLAESSHFKGHPLVPGDGECPSEMSSRGPLYNHQGLLSTREGQASSSTSFSSGWRKFSMAEFISPSMFLSLIRRQENHRKGRGFAVTS